MTLSPDTRIQSPAPPENHAAPAHGTMRKRQLDALRGVAILLMLLGHSIVVAQHTANAPDWLSWIRLTITRLSMPLFMMVSGFAIARRGGVKWSRVGQIALAAVWINLVMWSSNVGYTTPEILVLWVLLAPFAKLIIRFPIEVATIGLLQTTVHPIPWEYWPNYQPGLVAAFLALGVLLRHRPDSILFHVDRFIPDWVVAVGRRPLTWYVGHTTLACIVGTWLLRN